MWVTFLLLKLKILDLFLVYFIPYLAPKGSVKDALCYIKACEVKQEAKGGTRTEGRQLQHKKKISRCHRYKIKCSGFQEKDRVGRGRGSRNRGIEKSLGWENQRRPRGGQESLPE